MIIKYIKNLILTFFTIFKLTKFILIFTNINLLILNFLLTINNFEMIEQVFFFLINVSITFSYESR